MSKRRIKVMATLLLLAAPLLLAVLILRTPAGLERTASALAPRLAHATGGPVSLRGLSGRLPFEGSVAEVRLADATGDWLVVSNLAWRLSLARGWRWGPQVHELVAADVVWLRRPERAARGRRAGGPSSFSLIVQTARVARVHVAEAVAGRTLEFTVEAGGRAADGGVAARADMARLDAPGRFVANVERAAAGGWTLSACYAEEGAGWLCAGWPGGGATSCVVDARAVGRDGAWTGTMAAVVGDAARLGGTWRFDPDAGLALELAGEGVAWQVAKRALFMESVAATWRPGASTSEGGWTAQGRWAGVDVRTVGRFAFDRAQGARVDFTAESPGLRAQGFALRATGWQFDASLDFTNAPLLGALAGAEVEARGHGRVIGQPGGATMDVAADDVRTPWVRIARAAARADLTNGRPWCGSVALEADDLARSQARARHLLLRIAGNGEDAALEGALQGIGMSPATVQLRGRVARAGDGSWAQRTLQARAELPRTDLSGWGGTNGIIVQGAAEGVLEVGGTPLAPWLEFSLAGAQVQPRAPPGIALTPADFEVKASYTNGRAQASCEVFGLTDEPVRARLDVPVDLTLDGRRPRWRDGDAMAGDFDAALDLRRLARATDLRGNEVTGAAEGSLRIGGTPAQPDVRGFLEWRDGRVEVPASGTVLEGVAVRLEGDRERLLIREAHASDGAGGRVDAEGALQFRPAEGFPLRGSLLMKRAELWRRGGSRVRLDGRLNVAGSLLALQVTGEVKAVDSRIELTRTRPAVPVLDVRGIEGEAVASKRAPSAWRERVTLDVRLRGRDVAVAGRGLESQWRADLRAQGGADRPRVDGNVSVDRGYFLFMGRRFNLDRGALTLDGRYPPSPGLSVQASSRSGDMLATLRVEGTVGQPELVLESDPAYPTDEILSRLLFGKSTDTITAFQAVRLAHGLNLLRGRGTTLDVLERGQSLLRVDQLELKQDESSAELSSLSVGKYLGRSVYVQGQKGLGDAEDVISLEVEITPSLILQTEASPRIREGVGLKWRRDY